jgi:hypothetical protein
MFGGQTTGSSMNRGSFGDTSSSSGKGSSTYGNSTLGSSGIGGATNTTGSTAGGFMSG